MKPSNVSSSYGVFLETLNRSAAPSKSSTPYGSIYGSIELPTQAAQPKVILDTLSKSSDPMKVGGLATAAGLNVTPVVLALQQLQSLGAVTLDAQRDEVALTDLGRKMLRLQELQSEGTAFGAA